MNPRKPSPGDSPNWHEVLACNLRIFVDCWKDYAGTEQAGAQDFLRKLLDYYMVSFTPGTIFEQHPVKVPRKGKQGSLFGDDEEAPSSFTTERMDMYLPKVCIWEMKSPRETDLQKHHDQLLSYWSRMRTRYMVLCNFKEFWIYDTADEQGQLAPKLKFPIEELPSHGDALLFLRGDTPELEERAERVTAEVAKLLGLLVRDLIASSDNPEADRERVATVVLECVFAMFAEDTELIPSSMFSETMRRAHEGGDMKPVWQLFDDFARRNAKDKDNRFAPYVNDSLFERAHPRMELAPRHIQSLREATSRFDWQDVRPEIFGSIFEQALDTQERHELGAHFTREDDIARVVEPTVIGPWRERIRLLRLPKEAERLIEEMKAFHVLDPACGCGNFLYVVYREMKRMEAALRQKWGALQRKVAKRRTDIRPPPPGPWFTIAQLHGIELNGFAAFLARVVLWIGEHLAARELGLDEETLPLRNLDDTIRRGDALDLDWPRPEGGLAIVGNPPYLGTRKLRRELGDEYVEKIFARYPANKAADLVTYWFTRALDTLKPGERAGFVATNSIAQNESREASLDRIVAKGGTITDAWKSYPWPGEAAVHIGIVNWVMAKWEGIRTLEDKEVQSIPTSLSSTGDVTSARQITGNENICFMGVTLGDDGFILNAEQRAEILAGDPGSGAVIKPFLIGRDVNREIDQQATRWIVDFGQMSKEAAAAFPGAMRHVRKHVYTAKTEKTGRKTNDERGRWWQFVRPRPDLRNAIEGMKHAIVIPAVSPHLSVSRQSTTSCFDHQLMVIALSRPYHLGLLQSRLHEIWARARGSTLKGDLRYTNTTIFETFPFPLQEDGRYAPKRVPQTPAAERVAGATDTFDNLRTAACHDRQLGLTKIHNALQADELPDLKHAYEALNDAVTACYGFPVGTWRDETATLEKLLELNRCVDDAAT